MKFSARQRGQATVTSRDYDLTDYAALKNFVLEFVHEQALLPGTNARPRL